MVTVSMTSRRGRKITPEKALRILKKKMEKEGIFDEMKERRHFVPESEKKKEANRRRKNTIRKLQEHNS